MSETHPFARFVAILGRGKSLSRSLTEAEAEEAMGMILRGEARPEQIGAFLMLLRMKEETPEELAAFTRAARASLNAPATRVDLDWSSYAGKRRQLPWFLLAALTLAQNGVRVFMHGTDGHTPGRLYTGVALQSLGLPPAKDFAEAALRLERSDFAYLPLRAMSPRLADLIELKSLLGLRSPVNSFTRLINPFGAPALLQGVFHPSYMALHRDAAALLGQASVAVFRGEGGEIERRPNKPCETLTWQDGVPGEDRWPAILPEPRQGADEAMDLARLGSLWRGEIEDEYAEATIAGTLAIALKTLGRAASREAAEEQGRALWRSRRAALAS